MPKPLKTLFVAAGVLAVGTASAFLIYASLGTGKAAHASTAPDLLSALPSGAPTLIYIDLAELRASSFYQHRTDKGPITVPDQNYSEFMRSTGFDFEKDLDRVAIATWPPASMSDQKKATDPRKTILVAEGRFDRAKIRNYAKQKGKVDQEEGREVFRFPEADQAHWNSISFLDEHRIAIVEGASIAPLFTGRWSSSSGDAGNGPDPAREHAARMDGAAAFVVARVPPVPDNFSAGDAQSAQLAALARSVQWITVAAAPDGDNLRVSIEGECLSSTDARQLQAALEVLRLFGRAALESPKTHNSMDPATFAVLESLLKTADVTVAAERVRVLVEVTPEVLKLGEARKAQ